MALLDRNRNLRISKDYGQEHELRGDIQQKLRNFGAAVAYPFRGEVLSSAGRNMTGEISGSGFNRQPNRRPGFRLGRNAEVRP